MIAIPLLGARSPSLRIQGQIRGPNRLVDTSALSLQMYMEFDKTSKIMQFVESYNWVPSIGVKYTVGVTELAFP